MKTVFIVLLIFIGTFIFPSLNLHSNAKAAETSGLVTGMLLKCPDKPNCVCSEYKDDAEHYIDPITIPQNIRLDLFSLLKQVIVDMEGKIQVESDNYLSATFTSTLFKFVDDLEIRIDSNQQNIHIRSASRTGYSDFGVNKKRVALLKEHFFSRISASNKSLQ